MKWVIIITFNVLFGLFSGFLTNKVFYLGDRPSEGRNAIDKKKNKQMVLIITIAAVFSGMSLYLISNAQTKWYTAGLFYGIATTLLTPAIMFMADKSEALKNNAPAGVVLDTKLKFLSELIKSTNFMEVYIVSIFTLLYGIISLITPVLGLLWGYIMYKYLMKIE